MFSFGLATQWNATAIYLRALKEINKAEEVECCPSLIWVKRYLHCYYSHGKATEQNHTMLPTWEKCWFSLNVFPAKEGWGTLEGSDYLL